jgi:hypothetical protein
MEIPKFLLVSPELVKYCQEKFDYGGFYGRNDAAKMTRMYVPNASSMSPQFQSGGPWDIPNTNPNMVAPQTDYPQIQIDPAQNTAPITTNEIAPNGQGTFNGNPSQTIKTKPTFDSSMIGDQNSTGSLQNAPTQNSPIKPPVNRPNNIVGGINQVGSSIFDLLVQESEFVPNSGTNAFKQYTMAKSGPVDTTNQVGTYTGVASAQNGGRLSLKSKKPIPLPSYKEGDEVDLTTEQIHKLEQQGYKFQIL